MTFEEIRDRIRSYQDRGLSIFATSSFQTQSVPLLHLLSRIDREIPIYFLNTGYLFPETHQFRDQLVERFGITVREVASPVPRHLQTDGQGRLLYCSDTDYCCYLNKVLPLEPVLREFDVWVTGVRRDQTAVRRALPVEQPSLHGALRFHPLLDWTAKRVWDYLRVHELPHHPLDDQGYTSIGCEPCTVRLDLTAGEDARGTRWHGSQKAECGLHTELVEKP